MRPVKRLHESMAMHASLVTERKWQDKCGGGFVIIGRAGGPGVGPREKVAGTEKQISLLGAEEFPRASGGLAQLLSLFFNTGRKCSSRAH